MSTSCRRSSLPDIGQSADNPGLVFQKWLGKQEEGAKEEVPKLLNALTASVAADVYRVAFKSWSETVEKLGAKLVLGECTSPLAIGLGNDSPLEVGLTLNHTYGMPLIPGSAIKGLVSRALKSAEASANVRECLLGKQDLAGSCVFFDAWFAPDSVEGKPFHRDVVTVHHPEYYRSRGKTPPTDFDDPTPVPFLVVRPGAKFLFAIKGPSPEWQDYVALALGWALEELGVGAKTNAGYGRIKLDDTSAPAAPVTARADSGTETWERVLVTFNPGNQELDARNVEKRASSKLADLEATLNEAAREHLKGKARQITADIDVDHIGGKNYRIVAIRPMEETS